MSYPRWRAVRAALVLPFVAACDDATGPDGGASSPVVAAVRGAALPITGAPTDYDPLMAAIGDARVVLLGEGTHGTHEFYEERARITRRLVEEKGFSAVAVEGDWTDSYRVNRYVRGIGDDATAEQALSGFTDFPSWMWRNTDVRDLAQWLRTYDDGQPAAGDVGFYGLDLYNIFESADAVVEYLSGIDAAAAARVQAQYACFGQYGRDPDRYGSAAGQSTEASCRPHAAAALVEVQRAAGSQPGDPVAAEERLSALWNAQVVVSGEEYFREQYARFRSTWNLRDQHMAATLAALDEHLSAVGGRPARIVVWAHNTHAGDYRATALSNGGAELNLGQLQRQRHGDAAVLVGFTTNTGTVLAAPAWGRPGQVYDVRPAITSSFPGIFHQTGLDAFLLVMRGDEQAAGALAIERLDRAIGVIYLPQSERESHYFEARLSALYDAVVFLDVTEAVTPLAP
jgi:erythromycin esterase-like protein